jgi:hypothetical protein
MHPTEFFTGENYTRVDGEGLRGHLRRDKTIALVEE